MTETDKKEESQDQLTAMQKLIRIGAIAAVGATYLYIFLKIVTLE